MIPVRDYVSLLAANLTGLGRRVAVLVVALLVTLALQLFNPQLLREVIDRALAGAGRDQLVGIAVLFVLVALVAQVVAVLAAWVAEDVGWRATNRLRADLTGHVLRQDLEFHTRYSPGHLIERIDGDVTALSNFFSAMTVKVLGNALLVVGVVVLLLVESLLLGGVVGLLVGLGLLAFGRLHGVTVPWWRDISASHAEMFGQVGEHVDGTEDIVPNGAAGFMQARYADLVRAYLPRVVRGWTGYGLMWGAGETISTATKVAVVTIGGGLYLADRITIGTVFLAMYYVLLVDRPLYLLREQLQDLQKAGGAIVRIRRLQQVTPTMPPSGTTPLDPGAHRLSLARVRFGYPGEDEDVEVLRGIDLELAAGRTLGLVGRTGAGKSTLAKLAVRLHDPTHGTVRLGGVPLPELADLRSHVGMVTQDVQLFRATVRDNLTFFDPRIDDERLLAVVDELALRPWFDTLPEGLDHVVDGDDLSAGQAQLLAFGRIFLRDPGLVVLDEASSRLDPVTEGVLDDAVARLLHGRTGIIIAHRLKTLTRVDDVAVMEEGRVVEHGPRERLAADPGSRFARLLATGLEEVLS